VPVAVRTPCASIENVAHCVSPCMSKAPPARGVAVAVYPVLLTLANVIAYAPRSLLPPPLSRFAATSCATVP